MLSTIICAHPYEKSFNHALLEAVLRRLEESGREAAVIDLYADGFNPAMTKEELEVYPSGGWRDPLVERYNRTLDETELAVFIFPIWWYDAPAMLRGFFDKVLLPGSAYISGASGLQAKRVIGRTLVVTTSNAPTEALITRFGDPVNGPMIGGTFSAVGFHNARWENLGRIGGSALEERRAFIKKITELV